MIILMNINKNIEFKINTPNFILTLLTIKLYKDTWN
jgi:hypothetical protein